LVLLLVGGAAAAVSARALGGRTTLVGYFDNSNGLFRGDDVMILGVPVGKIVSIEPQPQRAKITFWVDDKYKIPADVKAVILLPSLITARAIELTPVYTGTAPRFPSNGTTCVHNCRSSPTHCSQPSPAASARWER
jgi:phospholipid/cholesterol/gamma-HCH transport system substrate-binding protein